MRAFDGDALWVQREPLTILIVEDDLDIRETLAEVLRQEGHRVTTAQDGLSALAWLGSVAALPCLIFLDLRMPVMDGLTFRQRQAQDPRLRHIPVVFLSASRDDLPQGALAGARYLAKPIDLDQLFALVDRTCPPLSSVQLGVDPR
jgi:CheY-like chemotaxis protein